MRCHTWIDMTVACIIATILAAGCGGEKLLRIEDLARFEQEVLMARQPVVVDFYKGGHPPCKMLEPVLAQLADEYRGRVTFARFELVTPFFHVTSEDIRQNYEILHIPTVILFVNGRETRRWTLDLVTDDYRKVLNEVLGGLTPALAAAGRATGAAPAAPGHQESRASALSPKPLHPPLVASLHEGAASEATAYVDPEVLARPRAGDPCSGAEPGDLASPASGQPPKPPGSAPSASPSAASPGEDESLPPMVLAQPRKGEPASADVHAVLGELPKKTHCLLPKPAHRAPEADQESAAPRADVDVLPPMVLARPRHTEPPPGAAAANAQTAPENHPAEDAEEPILPNAVLAEVHGHVITREDVLGPLRAEMAQWRQGCSREAFESRCRAVADARLRQVVSHNLLVEEAKTKLSAKERAEVEAALATTGPGPVAPSGATAPSAAGPQVQSSPPAGPKAEELERMLVQSFLRETLGPQVHVTQSELLNYYNRVAPQRYVVPTKVRLGLILIKKSDSATPERAQALAEAVHSRAAGGEDFGGLAHRYSRDPLASKGGDYGPIVRGGFPVKAIEDALLGLRAGEVGPLVETEEAFYIVKALDRQEGRTVPFAEVQGALEQELRDLRYRDRVEEYTRELYRRAGVRLNRENL